MKWYEEETTRISEDNNTKKISKIIIIAIIILVVLSIAIAGVIVYLNMTTTTLTLNGTENESLKQLLIFDNENSKIYVPIRQVAKYFNYKDYSGDYTNPSEDLSKCYVQGDDEVATFTLNSNIIDKYIIKSNANEIISETEQVEIDEPIIEINGNLCTTIDGIEKAFNVSFTHENNKITIYTMPFLIEYYEDRIENLGYDEVISDSLNNRKIVLDNMIVVELNEKVGVISTATGETILEAKYDDIQYMPYSSDFLVTSNNKVGIISSSKQTKVELTYDSIKKIDSKYNYYLVYKNSKYGIMDLEGNLIVYPDYDSIGINTSSFKENGISNGYIILDDLIPVKQNNLWGFLNATTGEIVIELKYDGLGCTASQSSTNTYGMLVLPDYGIIVAQKNKKYLLITKTGEELTNNVADRVYIQETSGNQQYFMDYEDNKIDIIQLLQQLNIQKNEENVTQPE